MYMYIVYYEYYIIHVLMHLHSYNYMYVRDFNVTFDIPQQLTTALVVFSSRAVNRFSW